MTRLCREGDGEPTVDPRSPYCYWHRAARMSPTDQVKLAQQRRTCTDLDEALVATPGKRCKDCLYPVPLWYMNGPRCKPCASMKRQAAHRVRTYGLDDDGHGGLLRLQGGRCAICRKAQQVKALAVDHNHQTGKVRGLLCQNDNKELLGSGYDSARRLLAAAAYLMSPPAEGAWVPPEHLDEAVAAFREALVRTAARLYPVPGNCRSAGLEHEADRYDPDRGVVARLGARGGVAVGLP